MVFEMQEHRSCTELLLCPGSTALCTRLHAHGHFRPLKSAVRGLLLPNAAASVAMCLVATGSKAVDPFS